MKYLFFKFLKKFFITNHEPTGSGVRDCVDFLKWTIYRLSNAARQLWQVIPISVKQKQFIRFFRFVVDLLNIEMFERLQRKISKARVFNARWQG